MAIPRAVLFFACVPVPPRAQAEALADRWGRLGGPLSVRARTYARQAEEAGDTRDRAAAMGLYSDSLLLKGDSRRAREVLDEVPADAQTLGLRRRAAVLALIDGDDGALDRLRAVYEQARADRDVIETATTGILLAHQAPGEGAVEQCRTHLASLRQGGHVDELCRLALVVADVMLAADEPEQAMCEALRSRAWARRARDRELAQASNVLVEQWMGRQSEKGVDDLVRVALDLGHETSLDRILDRIATSTLELSGADRAFVLLNGESGLEVRASAFRPGHSGRPSLTIAERTIQDGRELVTPDVGGLETGAAESIQAMQLRMVLCIPMSDRVRVLGAIYADSQKAETKELEDVAWLVRAFAAHAVVALRNAELLGEAQLGAQRAREVVHDVRNLASGMRLGLEELEELDGLPDWARDTLRDVASMNALLLGTVGALLEREVPVRAPVPLDQLLRRTADLMRFEARAQGVEIRVQAEPITVTGVERELARVAANLVGNALKYSPSGGIVGITLERRGELAHLSVTDEGPGVPEDALDTIFASGKQAEGAKHGYGLGLGICKHLVEQHGGDITVRNSPRGGAIFEVQLPASPAS
ncbi:MAG: ATP-binding protein [Myxococcota bacterium]